MVERRPGKVGADPGDGEDCCGADDAEGPEAGPREERGRSPMHPVGFYGPSETLGGLLFSDPGASLVRRG